VESLSRWFEKKFLPEYAADPPSGGRVFTVIGSGGKTSLIWRLALSQRSRKVLVSPTTKMYPPPPEARWYDYSLFGREAACFPPDAGNGPGRGICLAGILNEGTGKLEALPPEVLETMAGAYDLILLEGDGSRGLPLKGWTDHEPVVPPWTSVSIGIIPITPLGENVSEQRVFRLPQFSRLSGAKEGETLSPAHLAAVIAGPAGMPEGGKGGARSLFSAARGKKLLFINQVEDEVRREQARQIVSCLPGDFRAGLAGIIAGSVEQDRVEVLD
jgi:probable selenium-dependent hydroxylase accessory protein YqeC